VRPFSLNKCAPFALTKTAVNGSSTIRIETYCKDKNSGRIQAVIVVEGGGQIAVNKTTTGSIFSNLDLAVRTTAARVSSSHTRYFVGVAQDEATTVAALEDTALVGMPDGSNRIDLPAGKRIVVRPGEKRDIPKITDMAGRIDPGLESILDGSQPAVPPASSQPNTAVAGMTIQAARRSVIAGDLVLLPVWLIKGANVANLNLQLTYDANIIRPEGSVLKGNLLDNTLFTPNSAQSGIIRVAFAQSTGIAGTGTVVNVPFRAAGKPGDRSPLNLTVTSINDPNGGGALTELDALCALEMSTQLRPAHLIMDIDSSGDVTSRDAVIILQRAVGK
jgi:Cohesin domain